jgi:Coenzyme PQQ synthesis protein D (PqqD)
MPSKIKVSDRALFQEIENEIVILDLAEEQYYGLDDVGARMWRLLSEHGDTALVVKELSGFYNVDEAIISRDLDELLQKLLTTGLVTAEGGDSSIRA